MRQATTIIALAFGLMSVAPMEAAPVAPATVQPHMITLVAGKRPGYLGGYRGSRSERRGYRYYRDGYWYPPAAFAAPVVVPRARYHREPYCDDNFAPSSESRPRRCPRY
jgi:hypothetical protein